MKSKNGSLALLACMTIVLTVFCANISYAGVLLQKQHFTYEGAFRVPQGRLGGDSTKWSMGRGGHGVTYNPANNSLVLAGSLFERMAVEISIPEPVNSTNINDLNIATTLQVPGRVAEKWANVNLDGSAITNGTRTGNFLVYNNKLIGNSWPYYASADEGHLSHFTSTLNWIDGNGLANFSGFKRVGTVPFDTTKSNAGWTGGYMGHIPPEWQDRLGWPAMTGNGATSVVSRSSYGPSVSGFDPDDIGAVEIAPTELFFGYPGDHQTLGGYSDGTLYYGMGTMVRGVAFPQGSDTIMIFGRGGLGFNGTGDGCYGYGVSDPALHNTVRIDGVLNCYDLAFTDKGGHAYPYESKIWLYDANDVLAVKAGTKEYWEVIPYDMIYLDMPFSSQNLMKDIEGVAYDPTTQRLFISQFLTDRWADQYEPNPIIHVYSLDISQNIQNNIFPPRTLRLK